MTAASMMMQIIRMIVHRIDHTMDWNPWKTQKKHSCSVKTTNKPLIQPKMYAIAPSKPAEMPHLEMVSPNTDQR